MLLNKGKEYKVNKEIKRKEKSDRELDGCTFKPILQSELAIGEITHINDRYTPNEGGIHEYLYNMAKKKATPKVTKIESDKNLSENDKGKL